tara:strand:- start:185 stop:781 length:597 start_codon:yes stop_codon:yes gene_type:complete
MAKDFAPWSAETAQGIKTDPVDSNIKVRQEVVPAVNVGTISTLTGEWVGVPTSDEIFIGPTIHLAVANGATVLAPASNLRDHINMTGYSKIFIAIKSTEAGNFAITAVMGPDTNTFGGLSPVEAAANLKGSNPSATGNAFSDLFSDSAEALTADVWNIFIIGGNNSTGELGEQKNLQFKLTNNTGSQADVEFAFLRLV